MGPAVVAVFRLYQNVLYCWSFRSDVKAGFLFDQNNHHHHHRLLLLLLLLSCCCCSSSFSSSCSSFSSSSSSLPGSWWLIGLILSLCPIHVHVDLVSIPDVAAHLLEPLIRGKSSQSSRPWKHRPYAWSAREMLIRLQLDRDDCWALPSSGLSESSALGLMDTVLTSSHNDDHDDANSELLFMMMNRVSFAATSICSALLKLGFLENPM